MALVADGVVDPAPEQLVHLQRNRFVAPALPNAPVHTLCMGCDRRRLCQQCPRSVTAQMKLVEREQEGTCFSVGRPLLWISSLGDSQQTAGEMSVLNFTVS